MPRRTPVAVVAALAAGSLLLSACGSDDDSGSEKISGAKNASKSPSPSPSDDGIDRPEIKLPEDVKNVFEGQETGDPVKDAVLADNERMINALDEVITSGDDKRPGLRFYRKRRSLISAYEFIQTYRDADRSFGGTTRYYDRDVELISDSEANVTYCADQTKSYGIDLKANKKIPQGSPSPSQYVLFNQRMKKNKAGVWQTVQGVSDEGAERCVP